MIWYHTAVQRTEMRHTPLQRKRQIILCWGEIYHYPVTYNIEFPQEEQNSPNEFVDQMAQKDARSSCRGRINYGKENEAL